MKGNYLGYLPSCDPMHGYLSHEILPNMGVAHHDPHFRVFRLVASNEVYGYEEKASRACVIAKFYGNTFGWDKDRGAARAEREYANLQTLRSHGLVGRPHHVVRPLGVNRGLNGVLVVEHYQGEPLSAAIRSAVQRGDNTRLYWRLTALAYYLARQHNETANCATVNFHEDCDYLDQLVGQLCGKHQIDHGDAREFWWLRDRWRDRQRMWSDRQVWLHGDATPANFLFGGDLDVGAIDLERMKRGDRLFDVGRIAGELQNAFMVATGDKTRAEPYIGHFLWEYCCHFPDRDAAFRSITSRVPYYMGMTLLRIARNNWVNGGYRRTLVEQAKELLRAN